MAVTEARSVSGSTSESGLRIVGKRTRRFDAPERLAGQTRFTADLLLPGALYARFVRSPFAAARIQSIDDEAACALPGVVGVYTAAQLPVADLQKAIEDRKLLLAHERVLYAGQPVAVVLAETPAAAEDGVAAVEVEYEALPAVSDPVEAARSDARVVRETHERDEAELAMHGAAPEKAQEIEASEAPNVASRTRLHRGDVAGGFAQADAVVERTFRTSWVHQGYMEPIAVAATVDPLGQVVVYSSTQALFHVRNEVANTLGLAHHQVTIKAMPVGGAFGGKFGFAEPLTAALALASHRPVVLTFTREDEMVTSNPAPQSVIRVKAGGRKDGTLTALEAELLFDAGSSAGAPIGIAGLLMSSTYRWENLEVRGTEVLTNKAGTGAYRAPGVPQSTFAIESTLDDLAQELGIDPFVLRRQNAVRGGDLQADGREWPGIGLEECLVAAEPIYRAELAARGPGEGVGIALGGWPGGVEPAAAACRLNPDGTLTMALGAVDLAGTSTTFQMIAAEAFGFENPSQVRIAMGDSDTAPYAGGTGGSKITYTVGHAVERAARDAREQVLRIAADQLEASVEDLEIRDGLVQVRGVPQRSKSLKEIARLSMSFGARYEPVYGRGRSAIVEQSPGFAVHVARVRVDPETGLVQPLRIVAVQDAGKAINPAAVEGQMFGGAVQSVGWGLYERMVFDSDGTPLTGSLLDYAIPRASQSPDLEAVIVEVPSAIGPYGARPVGEPPVVPGAAALANAVRNACGARVTSMPMTAERVLEALNGSSGS